MSRKINVLLFTASMNRPYHLSHCLHQMLAQTYPSTHGVYLNSKSFKDDADAANCLALYRHLLIKKDHVLSIGYGPSAHQHYNHMAAIQLFDFNLFDLFLKIDDDDMYSPHYVKDVVDDFLLHKWDISGSYSDGLLNKGIYQPDAKSLCLREDDNPLKVMPGTLAFSKRAMTHLLFDFESLLDKSLFEDEQWINYICNDLSLVSSIRSKSNYIYHIHHSNISKPVIK